MKFISRLLLRMAFWLSPDAMITSLQRILSQCPLDRKQWERLSTQLCMPSNTDQPSTLTTVISHLSLQEAQLRVQAQEAMLHSAQAMALPHRVYGVGLAHDGVSWIAKAALADGQQLVGRGSSPREALNDFDEQWTGVK
ncbi:MAG: hypothetical protein ACYSWO_22540 [Planctomycetota bacterium]|jgi:hypothetical protein